MKKTNIIILLSVLLLSSIFMATSCKEGEDNTTTIPTIPENPMFRNRIDELNSYIGLTYYEIKAIMNDSLELRELENSYEDDGMRLFYYEPKLNYQPKFNISNKKTLYMVSVFPDTIVYEVYYNPNIEKVARVRYIHFYEHKTSIDLYDGYSRSLHNTTPKNKWFKGEIYCKDSTRFISTERDEFISKYRLKKYLSYFCIEQFDKDSTYNIVLNDSCGYFGSKYYSYPKLRYTSICAGNKQYEINPYQDK